MSKLSIQEIDNIANLARLDLSEEERHLYAKQISTVLGFVEMLNELDTDEVVETCQVTGLEDVFREDIVEGRSAETRERLLSQFPSRKGDLLEVKAVFFD